MNQTSSPVSHHPAIIIVDILVEIYSLAAIDHVWDEISASTICPACGAVGCLRRHARYQKYHLRRRIDIRRVRCKPCGTTHALIPVFSVPQMSLDMQGVESYLEAREKGASREVAFAKLAEQGWEIRCAKRLDKKLATAVRRAKAIWPVALRATLTALAWIRRLCGVSERPLVAMNGWALGHRVNAICFCRSSILFFRPRLSGRRLSHNTAPPGG